MKNVNSFNEFKNIFENLLKSSKDNEFWENIENIRKDENSIEDIEDIKID